MQSGTSPRQWAGPSLAELKKLSAVIISYNEEEKIERALRSVRGVVDEIVVMDSFSEDTTPEICRRYADRFLQRTWKGYRTQKQSATDHATHDWVLSLDADEVVSPGLGQELLKWKQQGRGEYEGYYLPRKTFFMGRWIRHTTWYPDWQLRLFHRSRGHWQGGRVHESFQVSGATGKLLEHLHHYTYASLSEYVQQLESFSNLAAADYYDRGMRAGFRHLFINPPAVFLKNYLLRLGFLDGVPGLAVSLLSAVSTSIKLLKLKEMQLQRAEEEGPKNET